MGNKTKRRQSQNQTEENKEKLAHVKDARVASSPQALLGRGLFCLSHAVTQL